MTALADFLLLVAGVLAVCGWLVPIPNGAGRFTFRYLAAGGASVAMWLYGLHRFGHHSIAFGCIDVACALWWAARAEHWWKATEKAAHR
jgi:hypothetical protein